jgi:hypothetical protein
MSGLKLATLDRLGFVYTKQKRYEQAESAFRGARGILTEAGGSDAMVAELSSHVALLNAVTGRWEAAEPWFRKAEGFFEKAADRDNQKYVQCLQDHAELLRVTNRRAAAAAIEEKIADVQKHNKRATEHTSP